MNGAVMKMPIAGGAPVALASQVAATDIAVGGGNVYWLEIYDESLRSVPITGGASVTLARPNASFLTVDATNVYWTSISLGVIGSVPTMGGATMTLVSGVWLNPGVIARQSFAVDDTSLYFATSTSDGRSGLIMKLTPK